MNPDELLEEVRDRESFLRFVDALVSDRIADSKIESGVWAHSRIEFYLDACRAQALDSDSLPDSPSWHAFAKFLLAGKYYE